MARDRWDAEPGDAELIRQHLERQAGLDETRWVRLSDGSVVAVGRDAEGEGSMHREGDA
jgi:hypothetical protein